MQTASKPKVIFEPAQVKKGKGWCVRVLLPHGPQPQIDGFYKRAEAVPGSSTNQASG